MSTALKALQKEVGGLSDGELRKFCIWFNRYLIRHENEKHKNDDKGIPYKDVLTAFKRANLITCDKPTIVRVSGIGLGMARFYKETRVKGCRVDDDADTLAAFWGPEGTEFRLAYMRELMPPPSPRREVEVWALTVDMRFPMTAKLQRLGSGHKGFQFRHLEAFEHFVLASRVATAVEELQPSRCLLSYQNVE